MRSLSFLSGVMITAGLVAQLPVGDHLQLLSQQNANNLTTVEAVDPSTGLPSVISRTTVLAPIVGGCAYGGSYCFEDASVDREGFLWVSDRNYHIAKLIPPPTPIGSRLVFSVDTSAYGHVWALAFDSNGDAIVLAEENYGSAWLLRIDHLTGGLSVLYALPFHPNIGSPAGPRILAHSNGSFYIHGPYPAQYLYRLSPLGGQYQLQLLRPVAYNVFIESPDGRILGETEYTQVLEYIDEQTGALLDSSALVLSAVDMVALPTPTGAEVWVAQANTLSRVDISLAGSLSTRSTLGGLGYPIGLSLDGNGRLYVWSRTGGLSYLNAARTAVAATIGIESYCIQGDPTSMRRALSVDRLRDDDGDSYSNLEEVRAGSNPFHSASTPLAMPPSLHCTASAPIGGTFTLTLSGRPQSAFLLAASTQTGGPIAIPGLVGDLLLGGAINIFISSSPGLPFAIPPSGLFSLTFGVPNNPALPGLYVYFQGVTLTGLPASTGFTNLASVLIL